MADLDPEREREQEHARKPQAGPRRLGRCCEGTRVIWRRLDCLKPNLQRMEVHIRRKDV
jgi:hypothetical protein